MHSVIGFECCIGKAPSCSTGEGKALVVSGYFNDEFLLFELAKEGLDKFFVAGGSLLLRWCILVLGRGKISAKGRVLQCGLLFWERFEAYFMKEAFIYNSIGFLAIRVRT